MPMPPYPIYCYRHGCGKPALYKIAARWSDGATQELKTYALACAACLADSFHRGRKKQAACRLAPGETLVVGGLRQKRMESRSVPFPLLNGLPVVGPSCTYESNETVEEELVVVVTPTLHGPTRAK